MRDLLGPAPRLNPVPGVPARQEVEAPSRIVPLFESRDLDADALAARHIGHTRIEFDSKDRGASLGEPARDFACAGAHVEHLGRACRGSEVVEQRVGERGAVAMVLLGDRAEGLGAIPFQVQGEEVSE